MFTTTTRTVRTIFAAAAVAVATVGLSALATAFLSADPHVASARQQAALDRVQRLHDARYLGEAPFRTAAVAITIR